MRWVARTGSKERTIEVARKGSGRYRVLLDGDGREVETRREGIAILLTHGDRTIEALVVPEDAGSGGPGQGAAGERRFGVTIAGCLYPVVLADPLRAAGLSATLRHDGPVQVRASMPGRIAALLVAEGDLVVEGQGVVVVEAMKMENELPAPRAGRVTSLRVRPGEAVEAGAPLFTVE
jgi:biotin carboxyl carrier protein